MTPTLMFLLHIGLYSVLPFYFATLSKNLRTTSYYIYIAILLTLGNMVGALYAIPVTETITLSGGSIVYSAFIMSIMLLVVTENSLNVIRSIIRLVVVVNLFLFFAYALFWAILESPETLNPFNVASGLYKSSVWLLTLTGIVIIGEMLLAIWLAERLKLRLRKPRVLAVAIVGLFALVLVLDGIFYPLVNLPFDGQLLDIMIGRLDGKLLLAAAFSAPMFLYMALFPGLVRRFGRAPIRLSELFAFRAHPRQGNSKRRAALLELGQDGLLDLAERLSTAAEAAKMGIWEFDHVQGTMDWDQRASSIHRVGTPQAIADLELYWGTVHEEDRPKVERHFSAMLAGDLDSSTLTYRLAPDAGLTEETIHVRSNAVTYRSNDRLRVLGAISDITSEVRMIEENQELEGRLHLLQKMEAVGRFAGSIAHDFNNLLTPIIGHTELSQLVLGNNNPVEQHLAEIQKAADRARTLIRQLLAFGGDPILDKQPLDLNSIITNSKSLLDSLTGASVNIHLDLQALAIVSANQSQIEQVLLNLAANSRDAFDQAGNITISTSMVNVDADFITTHAGAIPGQYARLIVEDDGCGMDKSTLDLVFEPYFTTKQEDQGTGLGMYTIYSIIARHKGQIWLHSSPGAGTRVTILLPPGDDLAASIAA